jgi:hypothetical protein
MLEWIGFISLLFVTIYLSLGAYALLMLALGMATDPVQRLQGIFLSIFCVILAVTTGYALVMHSSFSIILK